jgi:ketosteroid isomerase-like protein
MDDRQELVNWVETRLHDAEVALHNGDAEARFTVWTRNEPVTVLGAWMSGTGQEEVGALFRTLAASFSECTLFSHELIAADVSGDLGYTVGHEHTRASVDGEPRDYVLRVTQVYRREEGEWKVAHRHADTVATTGSP